MKLSLNDADLLAKTLGEGAAVSLNLVEGTIGLDKFGVATAVPITHVTLWPENTRKVYRSTEAAMTVSSSSTDDDVAGTGALTVEIFGVDGDWEPIKETATLTGQSGVTLTKQYMIVHRMQVKTAGSGLENAGILYVGTGTITTGKPAVVECQVLATENQSQVAFYAVPAGAKLLIKTFEVFAATSNKILTAHIAVRPVGGVFNVKGNQILVSNKHPTTYDPPQLVGEKSIVEVYAQVDATTGFAAARFGGVITNLTAAQIAQMQ